MPVSTPKNVPQAPYVNAPYHINEEWCIGDSIGVINANTTHFEDTKVSKFGDTMTGALSVQNNIIISNNGVLDLNCGKLMNFGVDVKTVHISVSTPGGRYVLQSPGDCGKIIKVTADQTAWISVPTGLPVGFNVMIICKTTQNLNINRAPGAAAVNIRNIYDKYTIAGPNGICNLVAIGPDEVLISGDLS